MTVCGRVVHAVEHALYPGDAHEQFTYLTQRAINHLTGNFRLDAQDDLMPNHGNVQPFCITTPYTNTRSREVQSEYISRLTLAAKEKVSKKDSPSPMSGGGESWSAGGYFPPVSASSSPPLPSHIESGMTSSSSPFIVVMATTRSPSLMFIGRTPWVGRPIWATVCQSVRMTVPSAETIIRSRSSSVRMRADASTPVLSVRRAVMMPPPPRPCVGYSPMGVRLP